MSDEPPSEVPADKPVASEEPAKPESVETPPTQSRERKRFRLFDVNLEKVSNHVLIGGMVTALVSATAGAYIAYVLTNRHNDAQDAESAANAKKAVAAYCPLLRDGFGRMAKDASGYRMNSYLLPRFPENMKVLIEQNMKTFLSEDKDFQSVLASFGAADYNMTMNTREADGSIFGVTLYRYAFAVNRICGWATGTAGDYLDMKPFN